MLESPIIPFTELRVGKNRLSGMVPSQLGHLSNLHMLDLSGNAGLGAPLPNWQIVGTYNVSVPALSREAFDPEVDRSELEAAIRLYLQARGEFGSGDTISQIAAETDVAMVDITLPRWHNFSGTLGQPGLPTEVCATSPFDGVLLPAMVDA
jgi:hypothetical protein